MHTLDFVAKYNHRRATAPGGLGGECVDLINLYLIERWNQPPQRLNAVDWQHTTLPGYRWTKNAPSNAPSLGALIVWNPTPGLDIGQYGHIALCLVADVLNIVSFDQSWPTGHVCDTVVHTYQGVAGWHELTG